MTMDAEASRVTRSVFLSFRLYRDERPMLITIACSDVSDIVADRFVLYQLKLYR